MPGTNAYIICAVSLITLSGMAACTRVPELEATIPAHLIDAPYPKLVQLDENFTTAQTPSDQAKEIEQSLNARRAQLQARSKRLQARKDDDD